MKLMGVSHWSMSSGADRITGRAAERRRLLRFRWGQFSAGSVPPWATGEAGNVASTTCVLRKVGDLSSLSFELKEVHVKF